MAAPNNRKSPKPSAKASTTVAEKGQSVQREIETILNSAVENAQKATTLMKTENWLQIHAWWWRLLPECAENDGSLERYFRLDAEGCELLRVSLQMFHLEGAFTYEMLARRARPDLIPPPWPQLAPAIRSKFAKLFPMNDQQQPPIKMAPSTPGRSDEASDPRFTDYCNWAFNLYNDDGTLARYFIQTFLAEERQKKGIPNPRPNQHRRHRAFSWRPVELLDIQRFRLRRLNNSESSQLSKEQRALCV